MIVLDTNVLSEPLKSNPAPKVMEWLLNRSELIRRALREHLERLRVMDLEQRDRRGYQAQPQRVEEYRRREEVAAWPED